MSKVINFNAREFRLNKTTFDDIDDKGRVVRSNRNVFGERKFITTSLGSFEMWEIGNWSWDWTQIMSEKKLEKNTDYIFRFAMLGGYCDTFDATSKVIVYTTDGYETDEAAWEDRMVFEIAQSRYEPIISKRDKTGLLRVFEIPFSTGEKENWRIVFVAMHAVAYFFAVQDNSVYEKLEDYTYDDWRRERESQSRSGNDGNVRLGMVLDYLKGFTGGKADSENKRSGQTDGSEYDEKQFADLLNGFGDGAVASLGSIKVNPSYSTEFYDIGSTVDGAVFDIHDADVTAKAFSMIIKKLGDGCVVNMSGIRVTSEGLENMYDIGERSNGTIFTLDGAMLPQKALNLLSNKRGDGCAVYDQSCIVE